MSPKDTASTAKSGGSSAFTPARIAVLALFVLLLIFIFENTRQVKIRLLIPEVSMPLYVALLLTAAIGAICGGYFVARRRK
ncbi:LapA family protein [Streptomyces sp. VRA16 Mangrove soil]|uniref:LapA family protein n=1 Tax=Streptomyces sp. VRA16 Mangrove soil TaxID=2817434 RepID=UPI001A9DB292|nr:LapA family protein [Streptomyces sp. VRA16 Mangrove soil]MBO1331117.1 LapA family protein [Streptomyces sp. VRA16 Mangrove soil]